MQLNAFVEKSSCCKLYSFWKAVKCNNLSSLHSVSSFAQIFYRAHRQVQSHGVYNGDSPRKTHCTFYMLPCSTRCWRYCILTLKLILSICMTLHFNGIMVKSSHIFLYDSWNHYLMIYPFITLLKVKLLVFNPWSRVHTILYSPNSYLLYGRISTCINRRLSSLWWCTKRFCSVQKGHWN